MMSKGQVFRITPPREEHAHIELGSTVDELIITLTKMSPAYRVTKAYIGEERGRKLIVIHASEPQQ